MKIENVKNGDTVFIRSSSGIQKRTVIKGAYYCPVCKQLEIEIEDHVLNETEFNIIIVNKKFFLHKKNLCE